MINHINNNSVDMSKDKGTVICFDLGLKRTGVAVGNNELMTSENLTTIQADSKISRLNKIKLIIEEWQPKYIVVGIPKNKDETLHKISKFCLNTGKEIEKKFKLPVVFIDEDYSSTTSEDIIKNDLKFNIKKKKLLIDQVSANIILQSHFNEIKTMKE